MRRISLVMIFCCLCLPVFADDEALAASSPGKLQVTVCAEGAAVINATDPDFAFGAGLRYYIPMNSLATFIVHGEFMRRNTFFNMSSIDVSGLVTFGQAFYYGFGLYAGYVLNMDQVWGWGTESIADIGWVADLGYHFRNTGITSGFSVHMGLKDLQPEDIHISGRVNQLNIRWGLWLGYRIR